MATPEHQELANFIKSVHQTLRDDAGALGTKEAWKTHCQDQDKLKKYASAMQQLAVHHWEKNALLNDKAVSRVLWIHGACEEYFCNFNKHREKEERIMKTCFENQKLIHIDPQEYLTASKLKLLDVGSCYNPFKKFEIYDVTAVDIAPANNEVLKYDFLNQTPLDVTVKLQQTPFDIIVFSLLLEYLPDPDQRLTCCLNAYKLLKPGGILTIITPDSNHVGSKHRIFKSWQIVLARHGFIRVKYEKLPYLHCMVFRKALFLEVAERWAHVHDRDEFYKKMHIPQDFRQEKSERSNKIENKWVEDSFLQELDCNVLN
ncbi:unnamed protein product [Ceutorhynchus assimilis]|uniref:S-adenosylmethionine sensor upstream of mTORC1 n=1 Tax=Ceutorhynchus assimilis TaxID=467358 RepID=A0A9N9MUN4_9CUCU|nr:unnamed protein product [Ceutorhynchus assimilis]